MNKQQFLEHITQVWYKPELVCVNSIGSDIQPQVDVDVINDFNNATLPDSELDIIRYFLVLNSINHRFWSHAADGTFLRYAHNGEVGANALTAGVYAAYKDAGSMDKVPLFTAKTFHHYFGDMPDLDERVTIINQAIVNSKDCAEILLESKSQGWSILEATAIADSMPLGYKDEALKKAQLALHMISSALLSRGQKIKTSLTCFADYQVPRTLRHLGLITYSEELARRIDSGMVIEKNSKEECAIRAATILACEELSIKTGIPSPVLDYWLWTKRNESPQPFHLTYTNAY